MCPASQLQALPAEQCELYAIHRIAMPMAYTHQTTRPVCRLNLAATCKALLSSCPRWFAELAVEVPLNAPHKVAHLAAWLTRHAGEGWVQLCASPAPLAATSCRGFERSLAEMAPPAHPNGLLRSTIMLALLCSDHILQFARAWCSLAAPPSLTGRMQWMLR